MVGNGQKNHTLGNRKRPVGFKLGNAEIDNRRNASVDGRFACGLQNTPSANDYLLTGKSPDLFYYRPSGAGGIRTGGLKGVRPLHGVTGATRRREGAWPPSGSTEASSVRLRIPTPSANDCLPYIKVPSPVLLSALQRLVGCERGF